MEECRGREVSSRIDNKIVILKKLDGCVAGTDVVINDFDVGTLDVGASHKVTLYSFALRQPDGFGANEMANEVARHHDVSINKSQMADTGSHERVCHEGAQCADTNDSDTAITEREGKDACPSLSGRVGICS